MKVPGHKFVTLTVLIAVNTIILLLLSCLHFYWGFGGTLWYDEVLPTNSTGSERLNPGTVATFVVAFALQLLALITIGNSGVWDKLVKRRYFRYGALLISVAFFARALGDFKFFGFFKTVRATRFGVNDTQLFSPLCVFIAVISLLIFVLNRTLK
ncbi:DUF3995 domain-containing protein [Flavitalea antarctica]